MAGGPGLFSQKTVLTPSFSLPAHWLGGDGSPVFSELPGHPHFVTEHGIAGKYRLAHHSTQTPSTQHRASPQQGPSTAQVRDGGQGLSGAQGVRGTEGWLALLPGLGPLLAPLPLWTQLVASSGQPCRGGRATPTALTRDAYHSTAWQVPPAHSGGGSRGMGAGKREGPLPGRGKQSHSFPDDLSNWPHLLSGLGVASLLFLQGWNVEIRS